MFEEKYLQEIPKYRKRSPKNRIITKSKHKHIYIPIKLSHLGRNYVWVDCKCKICMKSNSKMIDINTIDLNDYKNSIESNIEFFNKLKKERRKKNDI